MIESWARGFSKITRYCEEENAKLPVIDLSLGGVTARCFASDKYLALMNEHQEAENFPLSPKMSDKEKTREKTIKWPEKWPEKCQRIYDAIEQDKNTTIAKLENLLGIGHTTIKKMLTAMQEEGFIRRVGADKGGYWEIVSGAVE